MKTGHPNPKLKKDIFSDLALVVIIHESGKYTDSLLHVLTVTPNETVPIMPVSYPEGLIYLCFHFLSFSGFCSLS